MSAKVLGKFRVLATSRAWPARIVRIAILAALGWWGLGMVRSFEGNAPVDKAWPRTDFSLATVDLNEIISGGPPKDGIPAIDNPRFYSIEEADGWLDAREPVIVVTMGDHTRAYPLQILIYHEIVNDTFRGQPIAVTFCPLCNASIVFDRRIGGRILDFGTTGRVRKSDLVMYDRQTESWWQQFTGTGIVGHYAGVVLKQVPAQIVAYNDFRAAHPAGEVLSRRTGFLRPYGNNPYHGYDRVGDRPFLYSDPLDPRLPAMERVLGVTHEGKDRIYPFSMLAPQGVINDEFSDLPLVVIYRQDTLSVLDAESIHESRLIHAANAYDRRVDDAALDFRLVDGVVRDRQTGTHWNTLGHGVAGPLAGRRLMPLEGGVHFAFAWLAFRPNSEIYNTTDR
jgi:hypothetical protein